MAGITPGGESTVTNVVDPDTINTSSGSYNNEKYNEFGIRYGSDTYASDTQAEISREMWEDYKERFYPLEDQLLSMLSPQYTQAAGAEALRGVESQFGKSDEATERQMKSYGLQYTPEEETSMERQTSVTQSMSEVDAYNKAQREAEERQMSAMSGNSFNA